MKKSNLSEHYFYKSIQKLRKKCKRNSWTVLFKRRIKDYVDFKNNTIIINSRNSQETQLYRLLHEIGHVILTQENDHFERYEEEYESMKNMKILRNRIKLLSEEVNAWERGLGLAKKENIKINMKKFDDCKAASLNTYTKWIVNNG